MSYAAPLVTRYRPGAFDELIGHESIIKTLKLALQSDSHPHSYLLTGPSGIGKTTMARIIAKQIEAEVIEIDAATNNSADDMRAIVEQGSHTSLSGAGRRMFLLNEIQALGQRASDVLLTILEEPPKHLYFALTTTEPEKVREAIQTRCYNVALRALRPNEIELLVNLVAETEGWNVPGDVIQAVVQAATGQPRKALTILQSVHGATDREEVKRIISLMEAGEPLVDLCRSLLNGNPKWTTVRPLLMKMDDEDFRDAAGQAASYCAGAMIRSEGEQQAQHAHEILVALTFPTETFDQKAKLLTAIGRIVWGG